MIDDKTHAEYRAMIDKANAWVDTQRDKHGWASYKPEDAPEYVRAVTNDMRSSVEVYELHRDKPAECLLYCGTDSAITTWTGEHLGRYLIMRTWRNARSGEPWHSIRADLPGIGKYRGITQGRGMYVKLRRVTAY